MLLESRVADEVDDFDNNTVDDADISVEVRVSDETEVIGSCSSVDETGMPLESRSLDTIDDTDWNMDAVKVCDGFKNISELELVDSPKISDETEVDEMEGWDKLLDVRKVGITFADNSDVWLDRTEVWNKLGLSDEAEVSTIGLCEERTDSIRDKLVAETKFSDDGVNVWNIVELFDVVTFTENERLADGVKTSVGTR